MLRIMLSLRSRFQRPYFTMKVRCSIGVLLHILVFSLQSVPSSIKVCAMLNCPSLSLTCARHLSTEHQLETDKSFFAVDLPVIPPPRSRNRQPLILPKIESNTAAALPLDEVNMKLRNDIWSQSSQRSDAEANAAMQLEEMRMHNHRVEQLLLSLAATKTNAENSKHDSEAMRNKGQLEELQAHIRRLELQILTTQNMALSARTHVEDHAPSEPNKHSDIEEDVVLQWKDLKEHIKKLERQVAVAQDLAFESTVRSGEVVPVEAKISHPVGGALHYFEDAAAFQYSPADVGRNPTNLPQRSLMKTFNMTGGKYLLIIFWKNI